jgi:hypothetical protein
MGNERFDFLFAKLSYELTRAQYPKAELKFEDFMPNYGKQPEREDEVNTSALKAKVNAMFARMGGRKRGHTS